MIFHIPQIIQNNQTSNQQMKQMTLLLKVEVPTLIKKLTIKRAYTAIEHNNLNHNYGIQQGVKLKCQISTYVLYALCFNAV